MAPNLVPLIREAKVFELAWHTVGMYIGAAAAVSENGTEEIDVALNPCIELFAQGMKASTCTRLALKECTGKAKEDDEEAEISDELKNTLELLKKADKYFKEHAEGEYEKVQVAFKESMVSHHRWL